MFNWLKQLFNGHKKSVKKYVKKSIFKKPVKKVRAKFKVGDEVKVRKDATDLYSKWADDYGRDSGLWAGFDGCRQKVRGKVGVITEVDYIGNLIKVEKCSPYSYMVKFKGKKAQISMCSEWLEKVK